MLGNVDMAVIRRPYACMHVNAPARGIGRHEITFTTS